MINARLGVEARKGLEVYGFVNNLLDEIPEVHGTIAFPDNRAVVPARGRFLGLGIAATW